jgi:Reverse transcriptase (RNA-dependent DNA polymerase)
MDIFDEENCDIDCKSYENLDKWLKIKKSCNANKKFVIVHLNIRSLKKHWDEFIIVIHKYLTIINCIVLSETDTKIIEECMYDIPNFVQIAKSRKNLNRTKGGGLMFFVSKKCNLTLLEQQEVINYEYISAVINGIKVYGIYRQPDSNVKEFIHEIEKNILSNNDEKIILIGDFNINLLNEEDNLVIKYESFLAKHGFYKQINTVTREEIINNKVTATCIDHIFIKYPKFECNTVVIKVKISDHYMIGMELNLETNDYNNYSNNSKTIVNYRKLENELGKVRWHFIKNLKDPNEIYNELKYVYNMLHKTCSDEIIKNDNKIRNNKNFEWITPYIIKQIEIKDKLFRKSKSNPSNIYYRENYNKARNYVNKIIKTAKQNHKRKVFGIIGKNMRLAWQFINKQLGKKITKIDDIILRYFNDVPLQHVANNFAVQFIEGVNNVIHRCNVKFNIMNYEIPECSFYLPKINIEGTNKIIKSIDVNKAPGEDKITVRDILMGGKNVVEILTIFVNACIDNCTYPENLKTAIVRPIYKSGNHKMYNNYRPIALAVMADKVLQKHMTGNLIDYLDKNNIINENQYAFQKGKSCTKLIIDFTEYINNELESNMHVIVMFVDLSKAFDTLVHETVIQELQRIGVIGPPLELIKSYLKDRKLVVEINKIKSNVYEVDVGVGQGTNISPILFIIYVNTLFAILNKCKALMFADDLAIIVSHKNFLEAQKILQTNINHLINWAHDYGLLINNKKTKVMHIYNNYMRKDERINIIIHSNTCLHKFRNDCKCETIEQVYIHTYLGVIIDQDFKFNHHITKVINRIKQSIPAFYNLKTIVDQKTIRNIYFSIVHPFILYSIVAWGFTTSGSMTQLLKMQKRILKVMKSGEKFNENDDIFKYWNILPVEKQAKMALILEKYSDYHGELRIIKYDTRNAEQVNLKTPKYINRYGERTFKVLLPKIWNQIPVKLRNITETKIIKKEMKKWLILN